MLGEQVSGQTEFQAHLSQNVPLKHENLTDDRNGESENDGTVIISAP